MYIQGGSIKTDYTLSVDNLATVSCRKATDMSIVSGCCVEKAQNLHSGAFKYSQPDLPLLKLC